MRHYLLTRFNLRVREWRDVDKHGVDVLDDAWMEHRFRLFDKYTVPSVRAQTNPEFLWIVLFDVGTSKRWFPRIRDQVDYLPLFLGEDYLSELQTFLSYDPMGWIATTRLDNDDAIEPDFMLTIRQHLTAKNTFLNIPNGWQLRGHYKTTTHHPANPFMTYVERGKKPKTIFFMPHGQAMKQHAPIRQITEERLWTTVIHERNYLND